MKLHTILATLALGMVANVQAAQYCVAKVDYIASEFNGVRVYSNTENRQNDPMYLAYSDAQFSSIYATLVRAQSIGSDVKIYILEEQDGDDAASCKDGLVDYIGSVHTF